MKVILAVVGAVLCLVRCEPPPYPPSGWKPSGQRLKLPSGGRYRQYPAPLTPPKLEYGPPEPRPSRGDQDEVLRLKQSEGYESGVYHVLLPDGRLQRIEYATAPLRQKEEGHRSSEYAAEREQLGRVRHHLVPDPRTRPRYSQVPPVKPPVYAHDDKSSLVRIIRK